MLGVRMAGSRLRPYTHLGRLFADCGHVVCSEPPVSHLWRELMASAGPQHVFPLGKQQWPEAFDEWRGSFYLGAWSGKEFCVLFVFDTVSLCSSA